MDYSEFLGYVTSNSGILLPLLEKPLSLEANLSQKTLSFVFKSTQRSPQKISGVSSEWVKLQLNSLPRKSLVSNTEHSITVLVDFSKSPLRSSLHKTCILYESNFSQHFYPTLSLATYTTARRVSSYQKVLGFNLLVNKSNLS